MNVAEKHSNTRTRRLAFPHVIVMLFCVVLIAVLATHIVPAGEFDRTEVDDRTVVIPGSYHTVEQAPVGIMGLLESLQRGLEQSGYVIFFIFVVGGSFAVIQATGAIEAGIAGIAKALAGREKVIVPVIVLLFSIGGTTFGMAEETLAFIPMLIPLAIALGFDSLTGVGMALIGAGAGFAGAFMNPFTVGVAQGIAELPLFSGMEYRIIVYCTIVGLSMLFLYRHAVKVKDNPETSPVYELDRQRKGMGDLQQTSFGSRHKLVISVVVCAFGLLIYGVKAHGWYVTELSGLFFGMGIVGGLVGGMSPNRLAEEFVEGAKSLMLGGLVIGFATGVLVVLTQGRIMDTILNSLATVVGALPSIYGAIGMFVVQSLLNVIIPGGSEQAAITMPIMAPLADLVGVTRQTAVLAFQFGDGFSNILTPTSGYFMAGLALAGIKWEQWAKWVLPLMGMWYLAGAILVTIAHYIQLGPF